MDVCLIRLWTFYTFKYVICNRSLILHFFFKTIAQTSISFSSLFYATYIFSILFGSLLFLLPLSHSSIKSRFFSHEIFSSFIFVYPQKFCLLTSSNFSGAGMAYSVRTFTFPKYPRPLSPYFFTYSVGKVSYLP